MNVVMISNDNDLEQIKCDNVDDGNINDAYHNGYDNESDYDNCLTEEKVFL